MYPVHFTLWMAPILAAASMVATARGHTGGGGRGRGRLTSSASLVSYGSLVYYGSQVSSGI